MNRNAAYWMAGGIGLVGLAVTGYFAFIAPLSRKKAGDGENPQAGDYTGSAGSGANTPATMPQAGGKTSGSMAPAAPVQSGTQKQQVDFSWTIKMPGERKGTLLANSNIRKGAGTNYPVHQTWRKGTSVTITGETTGGSVKGSTLWYALGNGLYVHSSLVRLT